MTHLVPAAEKIATELERACPIERLRAYARRGKKTDSLIEFLGVVRSRLGFDFDPDAWNLAESLVDDRFYFDTAEELEQWFRDNAVPVPAGMA